MLLAYLKCGPVGDGTCEDLGLIIVQFRVVFDSKYVCVSLTRCLLLLRCLFTIY